MKILQDPSSFSFTNHFNQSLLKSRIEMMNRRKSPWMAKLKYGVFIGMLWVCAAFTKPYRAEVAAKIVEKVPELEVVFGTQTASLPRINDFVFERPVSFKTQATASTPKDALISNTKYVVYKNNKLYWVVTPSMGFDEFLAIHNEFEKVGATFYVKQTKYDPLQHYLLGLTLKTSFLKEGEDCYTEIHGTGVAPISAFGGWVAIEGGKSEIDRNAFDSEFDSVVMEDKKKVEKWITSHLVEYYKAELEAKSLNAEIESKKYEAQWKGVTAKFYSSALKTPNGLATFRPDALQYLCEMGARNRVYFEEKQLRIENVYKTSQFIINNQPSTLQQVEKLMIDDIGYLVSYALYTDSTRKSAQRTLYIFTKDSAKP
jgi:hypothetical protein